MKKATTVVGLFLSTVFLTVLMSAGAQEATPFPPEATVMPEGAVFIAPGRCTVSPDETLIAVRDVGVFNLPSGEKRFEFTRRVGQATFSPDSRFLSVPQLGLLDAQTGQVLIDSWVIEPLFSADGRFYVDYKDVYALPSLELVKQLGRDGDGELHYTGGTFINDDRWFYYLPEGQPLQNFTILDTQTWQPVVDMSVYPQESVLTFNPDYTRYAISEVGVFSYPDGEKLFELPSAGRLAFNHDSSLILLDTYDVDNRQLRYTFLDGNTGEHLNQFAINVYGETPIRPYFSTDLSKIALPDVAQVGTGDQTSGVLTGWRIVDVRTNELLKQWVSDDPFSPYPELGYIIPKYRYREVHGRNIVDKVGVFDVATDTLIKPMDGLRGIYLTAGGSYVVSQNPCTVWTLP